ncbi:unnamed protein product, partial [Mesorhabditis spiculigera]
MLSLLIFIICLFACALSQATINCYQCTTSASGDDFSDECSDRNTTCQGYYCTKGPDAKSNGMYRGCSNTPPIDNSAVSDCRTVTNQNNAILGNCYCNNIDFCNGIPEKFGLAPGSRTITAMIDDLIVVNVSIVILLVARHFAKMIPYVELGFNCDETDIAWPSRGDTIPSRLMFTIYFVILAVMVPITELSLVKTVGGRIKFIRFRKFEMHPYIPKVLFFYAAFGCSALATSVAANIFKRTSSRLRPNFLDTCRPANLSEICPPCSRNYIASVVCLAETSKDEHFSFPSGHAAHSANFAIFLILYLHRRMKLWTIVRAYAQYTIFLLTTFVCLTRIRDFKHRYTDVIGGWIFGAIIAFGMIHLILRNFRKYRYYIHTEDELVESTEAVTRPNTPTNYGALHHTRSIACLVK